MSHTHPRRFAVAALIAIAIAGTFAPARVDARESRAPINPAVAVTRFGFAAYHHLGKQPGNVAFSPASIFLAMSLLHAGAGGQTAKDLAKVMHLERWDPDDLDRAYSKWIASLTPIKRKGGARLEVANGVWVDEGSKLRPSYRKRIERKYRAAVTQVDFAGTPDKQRVAINAWIARHTGKKIVDLLPAGSIATDTEVVLANAIYFLGKWADAFDPKATTYGDFRLADGTTASVPLMYRDGPARFGNSGDALVLELPYRGSSLALLAVLPTGENDLSDLERRLSSSQLGSWLAALQDEKEVKITMPRFAVDATIDLKQLLTDLGLGGLFTEIDASRMFRKVRDRALGGAFHRTVVEVSEQGTEAAAATAITAVAASAGPPVPTFIANQPFLWMIRDTKTGAVLFMGRTSDPR